MKANIYCRALILAAFAVAMPRESGAGCECDRAPTIEITTPYEVCLGTDLCQYDYDPGQDGVAKYRDEDGNCLSCDDCPSGNVVINCTPSGTGPGYVTIDASITACSGSDWDSKEVAVVKPQFVIGEDHACRTQDKAYNVITIPPGHYNLIMWKLRKEGGQIVSTGSGQYFNAAFSEQGLYYVEALCGGAGTPASLAVQVGAADGAPESEACDALPALPSTRTGSYDEGSVWTGPFYERRFGDWTETFSMEQRGPTAGPGGCNVAVNIGSVQYSSSWNVSADLQKFLLGLPITVSYNSGSGADYQGRTKGPSPYFKYRLQIYTIMANMNCVGTRQFRDLLTGRIRSVADNADDDYIVSDWIERICRWCC